MVGLASDGNRLTTRRMPLLRRVNLLARRVALLVRPNPLFDARWYASRYDDVSGMDPYRHWQRRGARELRDPNPLFSTAWYVARYPDVAGHRLNPLDHYYLHGGAEGRSPGPDFDAAGYLERRPDVAATGVNPLLHYLRQGKAEATPPLKQGGPMAASRPHRARPAGTTEEEAVRGELPYLEVLARIHGLVKPELYLEIGVQHGRSLALATCRSIGIDPAPDIKLPLPTTTTVIEQTSDEFFAGAAERVLGQPIDLAFIDGLHLAENVLRDFINVELHSSPRSVVVIDDVLPSHSAQAARLRTTNTWTGDVWKICDLLRRCRPDLNLLLLDTAPTGLLVVTGLDRGNRVLVEQGSAVLAALSNSELPEAVLRREGAVSPAGGYLELAIAGVREEEASEVRVGDRASASDVPTRSPDGLQMTASRHLLIAGTGRAGTSLLVRLLHECGLQTVSPEQGGWHENARAGLENNLATPAALPYVVKSPWAHEHLRKVLEEGQIALDALILPVRNLAEAAASRIMVELDERYARSPEMTTQPVRTTTGHVPGGAVFSLEPIDQQRILAIALHRVIEVALDYDVPIVLLKFPRFATDAEYAYSRLAPVVPGLGAFEDFRRAFDATADPSSIRVETETLAEPSAFHAEPSVDEVSLAELEEAAVRRRLGTITREKRLLEQQVGALIAEVHRLRKGG